MDVSFKKIEIPSDNEALAKFITSQSWPFHVHSNVSEQQILQSIQAGNYSGEANQTFWILWNKTERIGIIRLFDMDDLDDGSPLFDIRILNGFQGKGIGQLSAQWLTRYLFDGWPSLNRIEGTTRADNTAMRKVFQICGYAKEGHYRKSWPADGGVLQDTVRYSILRSDWQTGNTTPVNWVD